MAKPANEPYRMAPMIQIRGKGSVVPPAHRRRAKSMAQQERQEALRRWLMISGAVLAALVVGVLIGRFLIP